ncbi:CASP1 protein, partial [Acromyrmex heyeri]
MEILKEREKQIIILKFLIELKTSQDSCYNLLKKVFKNRCLTRDDIRAHFDKVNGNVRRFVNQKKKIEKKKTKVLNSFVFQEKETLGMNSLTIVVFRFIFGSLNLLAVLYFLFYTLSVSHCTDNLCIPGTSRDDHAIKTTNNKREDEQFNERAKSSLSTIDAIGTFEKKSLTNSPPKLTALMPVEKNAVYYNMNHKNRGKCIIFNHEDFSMSTQMKREGSAKDAERLQKTFGDLGFDVERYNNFKFSEIQDVLKRGKNISHFTLIYFIFVFFQILTVYFT